MICTLIQITGPDLVETLTRVKPSSPGLDAWKPESLAALGKWFPSIFAALAILLNWVEEHSQWPTTLHTAYTSSIPKTDSNQEQSPDNVTPITVLSAVYRLWAKFRFEAALEWQEKWAPPELWGCRSKRGAEAMVYAMALHLETAADSKNNFVGGITYDFKKCFDLIPPQFLFEALQARGMSQRIIGPLRHVYANIHRVFKLRGECGNFWSSSNGLVQGCPLSMIGLNAIVGVILEISEQTCPHLVARSYADDISAIAVASSSQDLIQQVSKFHPLIVAFQKIGFGETSVKKSHTFGNTRLASQIAPQYQHCTNFRIVGGSL